MEGPMVYVSWCIVALYVLVAIFNFIFRDLKDNIQTAFGKAVLWPLFAFAWLCIALICGFQSLYIFIMKNQ